MAINRNSQIDQFLQCAGWAEADRDLLAGDASARQYQRVTRKNRAQSAVLMDASREGSDSIRAFVRIAGILARAGLSAPQILAQDLEHGFILLEDLGDAIFSRILQIDPTMEITLYEAAVDILIELHQQAPPADLVAFAPAIMAEQAGLVYEFYTANNAGKSALCGCLETTLDIHLVGPPVLALRDYHAENLIWLPDRQDKARVGLLDFQDAVAGPVGYDLVSLLYDARRDVSPALARRMIAYFTKATGLDRKAFTISCAALSAQRSLRILGVFARLSRRDGKKRYADLVPRVWAHLMAALDHPALADLALRVKTDLPAPSPSHLSWLKSQ